MKTADLIAEALSLIATKAAKPKQVLYSAIYPAVKRGHTFEKVGRGMIRLLPADTNGKPTAEAEVKPAPRKRAAKKAEQKQEVAEEAK